MEGHVDGVRVRRRLELDQGFGDDPAPTKARKKAVFAENFTLTLRAIEMEQPQVVFLWRQTRLTMACARATVQSGVPMLVSFHDEEWTEWTPKPFGFGPIRMARYAAARPLREASTFSGLQFPHAVCVSRSLKNALVGKGVPAQHAKLVYPGVDLGKFSLKDDPGSLHTPTRLLYVGGLYPGKGVHTLLEAARLIAETRGPEAVSVTVAGEGDPLYREQLNDQATACPNVRFMGGLSEDQVPGLYREHDVFVFPSTKREYYPMGLLRAAASGTTIVTTGQGGQGEVVTGHLNGLVFTGDRPNRLANRISYLMNEPEESRRLATDAATRVERGFSLARYVRLLEIVLQRVIEAAGANGSGKTSDAWEAPSAERESAMAAREELTS
jgi:glycosyltransferase involved in cell wall biosynthesis